MQPLFHMMWLICCPCGFNNQGANWRHLSHYACMRKLLRINSSQQRFFLGLLFDCFWLNYSCLSPKRRDLENDCVHSLSSRIPNNIKRVIKSKPQADRSILHSHFVLMSKHNTIHVNCCDPRNPPKRNIDILFVQRETLYNLHSLMTVHGNAG